MRILFIFILICMNFVANSQDLLSTTVCQKNYYEYGIVNDTSGRLFGNQDPLLLGGCSWTCNSFIQIQNKISDRIDMSDSLDDYNSLSICQIQDPIKQKIRYQLFLSKYSQYGDTITKVESKDIFLRGFIIANGNKKSKTEYFASSRVKTVKIYINKKVVGIAKIKDTPKVQYVDFGESYQVKLKKEMKLTIEIEEIYPGKINSYLCISELQLDGFGGHSVIEKNCLE